MANRAGMTDTKGHRYRTTPIFTDDVVPVCVKCGAIVGEMDTHDRWHAGVLTEVEELHVRDIVARNPGINEDEVRHYRATGELPERKA